MNSPLHISTASWSGSDHEFYQVQWRRPNDDYDIIDIGSLRKTATTLAKRGTGWRGMIRVPQSMYQANPLAYTPQFVSIGPFHRHSDNVDLRAMEGHKRVFMLRLLERTRYPDHTFRQCKDTVDGVIEMLCDRYYSEMDISSELLAKIILVDACFLLEVFFQHSDITNHGSSCSDVEEVRLASEHKQIVASSGLRRDLALLENQLPFCVLEYLFEVIRRNIAVSTDVQGVILAEIAFDVFKYDFNCHRQFVGLEIGDRHPQYSHLLDLVSNYARPSSSSVSPDHYPKSNSARPRSSRICFPSCFMNVGQTSHPDDLPPLSRLSPIVHLRSAKKLSEAGIRFEMAGKNIILDVKFYNGVFQIPPLVINECTESLLRNLMAFEHYSCDPKDPAHPHEYFASYVFLMGRLISHKEDWS